MDVMFFVCVLLVFMISYGTVVQALRYPNSPLSWSLLSSVIYHPFWFIHGQFDLDEMEGNVQPVNSTYTCNIITVSLHHPWSNIPSAAVDSFLKTPSGELTTTQFTNVGERPSRKAYRLSKETSKNRKR